MEQIKGVIRRTFIAGMVVMVPIIITVLALVWLFRIVDGFLNPVIYEVLGKEIPGLGFLTSLALIFIAGLLATNVLGSRLLKMFQNLLARTPVVKNIYPTIRQLVESFTTGESSFKKVVLVEFPQKGVHCLGFLTSEVRMPQSGDQSRFYCVYLPTNNLYLGQVALFKAEEVLITDFSVEEGLKIILSGGAAFPSLIRSRNPRSIDVASPDIAGPDVASPDVASPGVVSSGVASPSVQPDRLLSPPS